MAAVAEDNVLQTALDTGDVYTEDAKAIFNLPTTIVRCKCKSKACAEPLLHLKNSARQTSKIGHLAFQYGAGLQTFHVQLLEENRKQSYTASRLVWEALRARYHRTVSYWSEEEVRVKATGYSESRIMGRRRVYPKLPPITDIANYPIQSTASDISNLALIELEERLLAEFGDRAVVVIYLYDAFDVETDIELVTRVRKVMAEVMTKPVMINGQSISFPVEFKDGELWSDV